MIKDNFFSQPVGRAVLYLNDFHHGKYLSDLNRYARIIPDDVKGMASIVANTPDADATTVFHVMRMLKRWATDGYSPDVPH
jgi:hypothetical protein